MNATKPTSEKPPVVFVPGGVMPADLSYGRLLPLVRDEIQPIVKDLEVYASEAPPADYSLGAEVEGIARAADAAGAQRFHLVGFSGGGASSLAFVAKYPERVRSLALIEPAWIGVITAEMAPFWADVNQVMTLPATERMQAFPRWQMRPGVEPPKLPGAGGPPPPWMAKRPAGLEAMAHAFDTAKLDTQRFKLFKGPVYFALGSLSTRFYDYEARTLSQLFPDFRVEEYEGRSHNDPPHRAEPERFARALRELWGKS